MTQLIEEIQHIFEVWELRGQTLGLNSGSYGQRHEMRLESEKVQFKQGSGLPGKVWSTHTPVLFDQFRVVDFVRSEAARSVGSSAGIGLPVLDRNRFTSVFTILLGNRNVAFVCEVWSPQDEGHLRLRSGYYGRHFRFQGISSRFEFPCGQGWPGKVWSTRFPQLIDDFGSSPTFRRAKDAQREGLFTGLGIPVSTRKGLEVVLLLSSKENPLARAIEIWQPDGDRIRRVQASYGECQHLESSTPEFITSADGMAGVVRQTRMPYVTEELGTIETIRAGALDAAGLTVGAAFPIFVEGELNAVVVLLN
jgi:hypothetical protein